MGGEEATARSQTAQVDQTAATEENKDVVSEGKPEEVVQKRAAIDKQEAFVEFKQTDDGKQIDSNIIHHRQLTKDER